MYTVIFILLFFTEDVKGYVDKFLGLRNFLEIPCFISLKRI